MSELISNERAKEAQGNVVTGTTTLPPIILTPTNNPGARYTPPASESSIYLEQATECIERYRSTGALAAASRGGVFAERLLPEIGSDMLDHVRAALSLENVNRAKGDKLRLPGKPPHVCAEMLINALDIVRLKISSDGLSDCLIMRMTTGEHAGTWKEMPRWHAPELDRLILMIDAGYTDRDRAEIYSRLMTSASKAQETHDARRIWYNNGVYDYDKGDFTPYLAPDGAENPFYRTRYGELIRYKKIAVDYVSDAQDVQIAEPDGWTWSVDSHLRDVTDGDKMRELALLEAINMAMREVAGGALVLLNKAGTSGGANGKSATEELIRGLIGDNNILATPVEQLGGDFALEGLERAMAIIADESDSAMDKVPAKAVMVYKLLQRGETVRVNRKGRTLINVKFSGMLIQAVNGELQLDEKTDAAYRRIVVVPFDHDFSEDGKVPPRENVKNVYCRNPRAIEYLARRAMELGPIEGFSREVIMALKPHRQALQASGSRCWEYMDEIAGTLKTMMRLCQDKRFPLPLLYQIYADRSSGFCGWTGYPVMNQKSFKNELRIWVNNHRDEWAWIDTSEPSFRLSRRDYGEAGVWCDCDVEDKDGHVDRVRTRISIADLLLRTYRADDLCEQLPHCLGLGYWFTQEVRDKCYRGGIRYIGS